MLLLLLLPLLPFSLSRYSVCRYQDYYYFSRATIITWLKLLLPVWLKLFDYHDYHFYHQYHYYESIFFFFFFFPYVVRKPTFHSWEIVLHTLLLPLGLDRCLEDRGAEIASRTGSRRGLQIIQLQEGLSKSPTVADIAARYDMPADKAQTSLCVYSKYVRYWHDGIGRWYLDPPPCMTKGGA